MSLKYSLYFVGFAIAAALSVLIAVHLQQFAVQGVILVTGIAMIWIVGATLNGMTLGSTLLMISTFFLLPRTSTHTIVLAILALLLITQYVSGRRQQMLLPYPLAMIVLLVFGGIAFSKTYVSSGSLYFVSTIIVPVLIFIIIRNAQSSHDDILKWMRIVVVIATLLALNGVVVALRHPAERLGSSWSNAMTINGFYTIAFFFAIGLAIASERIEYRSLWIAATVIIFFGMVYTYTRIAMVAVIFGLFMLMLRAKKMRLYGLIAMGLMPLIIPSSMTERIATGLSYDMSIIIRLITWQFALGQIIKHPLTGIGFSTWQDVYHGIMPLKQLYTFHAHNLYINLAMEMGLIGLLAYLTLIGKTLGSFYRKIVKPENNIVQYTVFIAMLTLLVSCLTDIFIEQYEISILFWVTLALMYNATKDVSACKTLRN